MPFQAYLFHIYGAFLLNPVILPFRRMLISVGWLAACLLLLLVSKKLFEFIELMKCLKMMLNHSDHAVDPLHEYAATHYHK